MASDERQGDLHVRRMAGRGPTGARGAGTSWAGALALDLQPRHGSTFLAQVHTSRLALSNLRQQRWPRKTQRPPERHTLTIIASEGSGVQTAAAALTTASESVLQPSRSVRGRVHAGLRSVLGPSAARSRLPPQCPTPTPSPYVPCLPTSSLPVLACANAKAFACAWDLLHCSLLAGIARLKGHQIVHVTLLKRHTAEHRCHLVHHAA